MAHVNPFAQTRSSDMPRFEYQDHASSHPLLRPSPAPKIEVEVWQMESGRQNDRSLTRISGSWA